MHITKPARHNPLNLRLNNIRQNVWISSQQWPFKGKYCIREHRRTLTTLVFLSQAYYIRLYWEAVPVNISFILRKKGTAPEVQSVTWAYKQCSKWAGICRYAIPELPFVPEFHTGTYQYKSRSNSVSIACGYRLDDRAIEVRSPAEARDFSSNPCVHTGSGAHPASCTMGTGVSFPRGKARPGRDTDHSPHLVPRSWMSTSYTSISSPPCASIGVLWDCFTLSLINIGYNTSYIYIYI
jgi:hypothetical protein